MPICVRNRLIEISCFNIKYMTDWQTNGTKLNRPIPQYFFSNLCFEGKLFVIQNSQQFNWFEITQTLAFYHGWLIRKNLAKR